MSDGPINILVLGAGAVGGYFGGRLVEAGTPVTFLVREGRKARLETDGLRIKSPDGDATLTVQALTEDDLDRTYDVILLTCKAYDLEQAIETIRPAVGPGTHILPVLNGIRHLDTLEKAFPSNRVLGGLVKIAATQTPDGTIEHLNDWQFITFGALDGQNNSLEHRLKALFDRTRINATLTGNIRHAMWEKLVHLATVAGATTLMRASVGEIARTEHGAALMVRLLEANAEIARREGYPMSASFLDDYRKLFSDTTSPYTASMLRDIERHGPIEADHIIGHLYDRARDYRIETDFYTIIYTSLKAYEQRRAANRF